MNKTDLRFRESRLDRNSKPLFGFLFLRSPRFPQTQEEQQEPQYINHVLREPWQIQL